MTDIRLIEFIEMPTKRQIDIFNQYENKPHSIEWMNALEQAVKNHNYLYLLQLSVKAAIVEKLIVAYCHIVECDFVDRSIKRRDKYGSYLVFAPVRSLGMKMEHVDSYKARMAAYEQRVEDRLESIIKHLNFNPKTA